MYFTLMTAQIGKTRNFINRLSSIHSCNTREGNGAGKKQGKTITKAHFLYGPNQQVFDCMTYCYYITIYYYIITITVLYIYYIGMTVLLFPLQFYPVLNNTLGQRNREDLFLPFCLHLILILDIDWEKNPQNQPIPPGF